MWRNDIKCKYMFMFSLKNLARKGLTHIELNLFWGNVKNLFAFVISQHWDGKSSWKENAYLFCIVNIMAADDLSPEGARASVVMVLTLLAQNVHRRVKMTSHMARTKIWLQWTERRQLQEDTRNIWTLGFGATYTRGYVRTRPACSVCLDGFLCNR